VIGRGIWYISAAHTQADIDETVAVAGEVLREMRGEEKAVGGLIAS